VFLSLTAAAGWPAGKGLNDLAFPFPIFLLDNSTAANAAQRALENTQPVRLAAAPCAFWFGGSSLCLLAFFLCGGATRQPHAAVALDDACI
jgi:hypothetical protein